MPWIFAYLILFIIIILAFRAAFKEGATWRSRFRSWFFLFLPVAIFMWDYPVVYYRHVQDCKAEGGLKVFIKPEKADLVQFDPRTTFHGKTVGEDMLRAFYPRIKYIEAGVERYSHTKLKLEYDFYKYSVTKTTGDKYKRDWEFKKVAIHNLSEGMFIISKSREYDKALHRSKEEWRLMRDGKLYAKVTQFVHSWPKIQYPDASPSWACEKERSSKSNPFPYSKLMNFILN